MNPNKKIFKTTKNLLKLANDNYIIFFRGVYSRGGYIPHAFYRRGGVHFKDSIKEVFL